VIPAVELRKIHRDGMKNLEHYKLAKTAKTVPVADLLRFRTAFTSSRPLSSLKSIAYRNMLFNTRAEGRYILVRTLEPPLDISYLITVAEDHTGTVFMICLYNIVSERHGVTLDDPLPSGTVLVIKEPLITASDLGECMIRTDSPADVIVIAKYSGYPEGIKKVKWKNVPSGAPASLVNIDGKTAKEWIDIGNKFYAQKMYRVAREAYGVALQLAIEKCDEKLQQLLHLSLAAVFLALEHYDSTIEVRVNKGVALSLTYYSSLVIHYCFLGFHRDRFAYDFASLG